MKLPAVENQLTPEESTALVDKWRHFALKLAKKWWKSCPHGFITIEDLRQEALMGFYRASKTFDKSLGYSFSTYATTWGEYFIRKFLERERRRGLRGNDADKVTMKVICSSAGMGYEEPIPTFDLWDCVKEIVGNDRRYFIIESIYRHHMTQTEVAKALGVSHQAIHQTQLRTLAKLAKSPRFKRAAYER
jgi:RNA polymerase sigma factor (sigma-70 family)